MGDAVVIMIRVGEGGSGDALAVDDGGGGDATAERCGQEDERVLHGTPLAPFDAVVAILFQFSAMCWCAAVPCGRCAPVSSFSWSRSVADAPPSTRPSCVAPIPSAGTAASRALARRRASVAFPTRPVPAAVATASMPATVWLASAS